MRQRPSPRSSEQSSPTVRNSRYFAGGAEAALLQHLFVFDRHDLYGSSAESVGDFGFGEFSEGVIQRGLQGLDVPKTAGFSHRQFRL